MSGPVTAADAPPGPGSGAPAVQSGRPGTVEVLDSRTSRVGALEVRRALPKRGHRTVGAWCFADHLGPVTVTEPGGADIGPHPHIGLQTVTWLLAGELVHRDSLGSEQTIRPGQLNLMTAGHGVAHAEEALVRAPHELHGIQLWVAQPSATRDRGAAFEHHAELPRADLDGPGTAAVLVGAFAGVASPARRDTDHLGADLDLRAGTTTVPLDPAHEHALIVLTGAVVVDGADDPVTPGHLAYLAPGRSDLALTTRDATRVMLLGGAPFPEEIRMWWNFVARTPEELADAAASWRAGDDRFHTTGSTLPRIPAPSGPV